MPRGRVGTRAAVCRPGPSFAVNQWNRISCLEATARDPANQLKNALGEQGFSTCSPGPTPFSQMLKRTISQQAR